MMYYNRYYFYDTADGKNATTLVNFFPSRFTGFGFRHKRRWTVVFHSYLFKVCNKRSF